MFFPVNETIHAVNINANVLIVFWYSYIAAKEKDKEKKNKEILKTFLLKVKKNMNHLFYYQEFTIEPLLI